MAQHSELLVEGSYNYLVDNTNYSQENFKLFQSTEANEYFFQSEILSRLESGEFLKILVRFELTGLFVPFAVKIEKAIGQRFATESFEIDLSNQELVYRFENAHSSENYRRPINAKHYLTSPSFASSTIFTLSKKFDATGRTPIILVNSQNDWEYSHPPSEKVIYAEYKTRDAQNFKLNDVKLAASHLCLYEHDSTQVVSEQPVEIFISKHYAIPYQLTHGNRKIVIKHLKKF